MTRLCLEFAGCGVRVDSTDPAPLAWLREFAGPSFTEDPDAPVQHEVVLRGNAGEFAALHARGSHPSGRFVDFFALDTRMVSLPLWNGPTEEPVVFDEELGTFYRQPIPAAQTAASARSVTEILWRGEGRAVRTALLRVVREMFSAHLIGSGALLVHGAAFAAKGAGYVIAGPKRAGKTTLLLHILEAGGTSYVSNDRVVLSASPQGPVVRNIPTIVSIRPSTLSMLPHLADRFRGSGYHHNLTIPEARRLPPVSTDGAPPSTDFSPAQVCELLGVDRTGQAKLAALLFPRLTRSAGEIRLEPLTAESAAQRLRASLFRTHSTDQVGEWFAGVRHDVSRIQMCEEMAAASRAFDCWLGTDAYEDLDSAARLLSALQCGPAEARHYVRTYGPIR